MWWINYSDQTCRRGVGGRSHTRKRVVTVTQPLRWHTPSTTQTAYIRLSWQVHIHRCGCTRIYRDKLIKKKKNWRRDLRSRNFVAFVERGERQRQTAQINRSYQGGTLSPPGKQRSRPGDRWSKSFNHCYQSATLNYQPLFMLLFFLFMIRFHCEVDTLLFPSVH